MKKLILLSAISFYSFAVPAQNAESISLLKQNEIKYCVGSDNGKTMVKHDGKTISDPVTLMSGAVLNEDGVITWKDKSRTKLKSGYCIDESGKVFTPRYMVQEPKMKTDVAVD